MKRFPIQLRILLAMMAVIGSFVALTSWVVDGLVDRFLQAEIESSLERGREASARFSKLRNAVLLDQARSVAQVPHLRAVLDTPGVDERTIEYTIATLSEAVEAPLMFVTDSRARILADTLPQANPPELLDGFPGSELALRGEEYCGIIEYAGEPYLVAICPVTIDSTVLGIFGIGCRLAQHAADLHGVTGLDVSVLHEQRQRASAWSGPTPMLDTDPWSNFVAEQPARLIAQEREFMAISIPLEPSSERLILSRPLDLVLAYFQRAKNVILLGGLVVALVALLVSRWIAGRIASPIRELTAAANTLASGDLSAKVCIDTRDEIGVLSQAFNAMARQLEASMERAMQKALAAEQANAAKSVFLATMSHELRTPLNGVLGFTEQLLASEMRPEQREQAHAVQRSGEDLLAIIDDVLTVAKLGKGELTLEVTQFNLRACLVRILAEMDESLVAKGLRASLDVAESVPLQLHGPADRVRQVMRSYLSNAMKFSSQGQIVVRASLDSETAQDVIVRLEVEDCGIGIAPDQLEHLFKPFSQLDAGTNRRYGGAGLGLAICKDLAERMGGEVGVESSPGRGSTFWFTAKLSKLAREQNPLAELAPALPLSRQLPAASCKESTSLSASSGDVEWRKTRRILIAEDNLVNQKVTAAMLTRAGWPFAVAENGRRVLELMAVEHFDLILMDCQMPIMDGLEATRTIRDAERATGKRIPIVALTANAFSTDRDECLAAGMDGFLPKPVKAAELIAELERWLGVRTTCPR